MHVAYLSNIALCCSHVINLVVSGASQLPSIRNAVGIVASVCVFILRPAQLFCKGLPKRKHRHLVETVNVLLL